MSSRARRFFSGPSVEAALMRAARFHEVEPARLAYRRLEKRHGFLKVRRSVVIEVDPEAPLLDTGQETEAAAGEEAVSEPVAAVSEPVAAVSAPEAATSPSEAEARRPAPPDGPEPIDDEMLAAAGAGLEKIFEVAALDLESRVERGEEQIEVELSGRDQELLVAERGRLLLSIQHLLPRLIRGLTGRSVACRLDSENFHESRRDRLNQLAERSASEVRRRREPWTMEPMAPDERRIIHLALADDPEVVTESEGHGYFKRVTIRPAQNRRPRGFDRYSR